MGREDTNISITVEQAKNSAECKFRKYQFWTVFIICSVILSICAIIILPMAFRYRNEDHVELISLIFIFVIVLCIFVPMAVYSLVRYKRVIRAVETRPVYRVTLDKSHGIPWARAALLYYTVELHTENGVVTVDTTAMFAASGVFAAVWMEDYNNKDVYVLYDEERDRVYVIDLVEKIDVKQD